MRRLKIARMINRIFWLVVCIVVNLCVGYEWAAQACSTKSIVMAVFMYCAMIYGIYKTVDIYIGEYIKANS